MPDVEVRTDLPGGCQTIALPVRGDDQGRLVALETGAVVPFAIARAYYIFATLPGVTRGRHAHRRLTQLAVAVSGSCTMTLDDGERRASIRLDNPAEGLIIGSMVWREMSDFSPDCVLLVLADSPFDEDDYIRDYALFQELSCA